MERHQTTYSLRNEPERVFTINAGVADSDSQGDGASIEAEIREADGDPFNYVVDFSDEFVATKTNFTPEMFLHTAISIICAQIESHQHRPTRLRVHRDSGLIETEALKA